MKRTSIILALAAIMLLASAGSAFANFGPHGGYALDTDACAGCHRAHTSFSDATWKDSAGTKHSALLVSDAATMQQFCYTCHGDAAPGASTNVQSGVFDGGPSGEDGELLGGAVAYVTNSAFDKGLNGGGFDSMPTTSGAIGYTAASSMHDMEKGSATDPMWGAGSSAPAGTNLTCTDCHDPHGSSNYRILKDKVNGVVVGGYDGETPQPFVFSSEENYPAGGWLKHEAGSSQMTAYRPNYTTAEYKWRDSSPSYITDPINFRSMSTWCSACHQAYNDRAASTYDYKSETNPSLSYEAVNATRTAGGLVAGNGVAVGAQVRHRHKVDITLAAGVGVNRALVMEVTTSTVLPLEASPSATHARGVWDTKDYMGCLTCHRAHGSQAAMSGWAVSSLQNNASAVSTWYPVKSVATVPSGVNPNFSSALLRTDNRGVCERCHNK